MNIETLFVEVCRHGNINSLGKLLENPTFYEKYVHEAFEAATIANQIEVMKLLISKFSPKIIDIHRDSERVFRRACSFSELKTVKYLLSLRDSFRINLGPNGGSGPFLK